MRRIMQLSLHLREAASEHDVPVGVTEHTGTPMKEVNIAKRMSLPYPPTSKTLRNRNKRKWDLTTQRFALAKTATGKADQSEFRRSLKIQALICTCYPPSLCHGCPLKCAPLSFTTLTGRRYPLPTALGKVHCANLKRDQR